MNTSDKALIKVLHIYRTYFPDPQGGMQEAIRQLCLATKKYGVANAILTLSPKPSPKKLLFDEAEVYRERSWISPASCDIGGLNAFKQYRMLEATSDIIHILYPWPFADILHTASNKSKPLVVTYVSDIVRQKYLGALYAPMMWKTLKKADAIIANCPAYAKTSPVLSHPDIKRKVRIVPLGIDEASYPQAGDESTLEMLNLKKEEPFFLFIGVLRYYKGLHSLIQASCKLDAKIIIAGFGPEQQSLKSMASGLGASNVVFAGQVSDSEKVSLLRACRALILPSHLRSEAFGMVLVEAGMYSKPAISCEIGTGTSYINLDQETGLVIPPDNSEKLADAMSILLNDKQLAEKYGAAARKRYERFFSASALGKAYSALYSELLNR